MNDNLEKLRYTVIGKAMETHRELGPGLDEDFYHRLLSAKLSAAGVRHQCKPKGRLMHRGLLADEFEADMIVDGFLIPELKVLEGAFAPDHFTQIICYLKFWKIRTGLLMDFGKESLTHKRILFDSRAIAALEPSALTREAPHFASDRSLVANLWQCIGKVHAEYGFGYRDTTYRGLLAAELSAEKCPFRLNPEATIALPGMNLGLASFPCLVVADQCGLLVLALRERIRAADRAILQTYLKHLGIPWGLIVNFGKDFLEHKYVIYPQSNIRGRPESVGPP